MLAIAQAQNTQALAPAASTWLLRNFSELAPAGTPYAGLPIASGQWWGLTGSEIADSAGSGEHGAGLLANDSLDPAAEYRLVVRNSTFAAGALTVEEDGAIEYLSAGTAVYDLYQTNLLVPGGPWAISGGFLATYSGTLPPMVAGRNMPAVAAVYSAVLYSGTLTPMVSGSSMTAITLASYIAAWQRALREYTLLAPVDQIDHLGGFAEKDPAARVTLAFEFKRYTATPDTATVEIAVWRGTDGSALSVLDGAPAIVGTKVYQRVLGGLHDTDYKLTCMLTDAGGQAYVLTGVLPVRRR